MPDFVIILSVARSKVHICDIIIIDTPNIEEDYQPYTISNIQFISMSEFVIMLSVLDPEFIFVS